MGANIVKENWYVDREVDGNIWIASDQKCKAIANVCSDYNEETEKYEPNESELANAKLMAAAPKMLEVLETIENDNNQVPDWLWKRIKSVIKKAKE